MAKPWCVSTSHPIVREIAKKYNLTLKDAKTIYNDAAKDNPALQTESVNLEFVESQDTFKEALDIFQKDKASADNLFKNPFGTRENKSEIEDEIREILEQEMSDEEIEDRMEMFDEVRRITRTSVKNATNIARILKSFNDARKLEFLGSWVCRKLSSMMTTITLNPSVRQKYGIAKHERRIDYFRDPAVMSIVRQKLIGNDEEYGMLDTLAEKLEEQGKTEQASELKSIVENFNTVLFMFGGRVFREEGVEVGIDGNLSITESASDSVERNDIAEDEDEDNDDPSEQPVNVFSSSDQNKSITTKIVPDIKSLLNGLEEVTSGGKKVADPYGYGLPTFVSVPKVVNKLLLLLQGCQTYSEMVEVLKNNQRANPWMTQLLTALDTTSELNEKGDKISGSKKEQLQTMFFKSMMKQFTRFKTSYVQYAGGLPIVRNSDANVRSRVDSNMRSVQKKFRTHSGIPIFKNLALDFDRVKAFQNELKTTRNKVLQLREEAQALARKVSGSKIEEAFAPLHDKATEIAGEYKKFLENFGIKLSKQVFEDFMANTSGDVRDEDFYEGYKGDKLLANKISQLDLLHKAAFRIPKELLDWKTARDKNQTTDNVEYANPFSRKKGNSDYKGIKRIRTSFEKVLNLLTEFSEEAIEPMAYINHKSYYSYNNPSSILTIINNLKNKNPKKLREYILKKYGKDIQWFMKPGSTARKPQFYSSWLQDIVEGNGREIIDYAEKPMFCGNSYNEMSDIDYTLSILNDYFTLPEGSTERDKAWYRMLIASDKPRYSMIKGRRYSVTETDESGNYTENDYHFIIARFASDFFAQELRRCMRVVNYAVTNKTGTTVDNYDITGSTKKALEPALEKMRNGEKVTVSDVVKDGRYLLRGTGGSFFLNKFINDEIEAGTELGQFVVDRIFNTSKKEEELIPANMLRLFREGFHNSMSLIMEDTFKHMRDIGLFKEKTVTEYYTDEEGKVNKKSSSQLEYLLGSMLEWYSDDVENFSDSMEADVQGAKDIAEYMGENFDEDKGKQDYYLALNKFSELLEEFIYNNWLAKANMSEIFDVDLAFYGRTTNFQKRNAQVISSGYPIDTEAKIHGKPVSDGKYRSITLQTHFESDIDLPNIKTILERWEKQITDPRTKQVFLEAKRYALKELEDIDTTDGQAFTGLTGLRKRQAGLGEWTISDDRETDIRGTDSNGNAVFTSEAIYQRMKRGYMAAKVDGIDCPAVPEIVKIQDFSHVFAQPQKPFVYAFTEVKRGNTTLTVPVQHKNSEFALVFLSSFFNSGNSQLSAIARFLEETAKDNPEKGIDTVNFDSCVKIGNNSRAIDLYGLTPQQTFEKLMEEAYETDKEGKKHYRTGTVTEYDAADYKIVQEKPEHYKSNAQPLGSQVKILAISNIPDTATCTMPDGKTITGKELKQRYFKALRGKTKSVQDEFRKELGLFLPHKKRLHSLSVMLKKAMSTDQKFTVEMRRALSIAKIDGEDQFVLPLDEIGQQSAVESMLYSKIRRIFYKQKTNGGVAVQVTSWGEADDLHVRFYSSNPADKDGLIKTFAESGMTEKEYQEYIDKYQQEYAYFEMELPMPDYIRKMLTDSKGIVQKKYYNSDGTWNMDEIEKDIPASYLEAIAYRIPTEEKYSIQKGRVKRFAPDWAGSSGKYSKNITKINNSDFDIDTIFVELRPEPSRKSKDVDNELFDLQLAALTADASIATTFKPGDFSDLSELSYYITLLRSGKYTRQQLDGMTTKELKNACMEVEDLDLMSPVSDILLHNQNSDASKMIGIAAVGVASHAFLSLYNDPSDTNIEHCIRMRFSPSKKDSVSHCFTVINDKNGDDITIKDIRDEVVLDAICDMDGRIISSEVSKYVGASADAAKDAAEYRLNITTNTIPILVMMHRLGVSSDVARVFISNPVVRDVNAAMRNLGLGMEKACEHIRDTYFAKEGYDLKKEKEYLKNFWLGVHHSNDTELRYSKLLDAIAHPDEQGLTDKLMILHTLMILNTAQNAVRNLDSFTRYNSSTAMKGTSFLDRYAKRMSIEKLEENLAKETILLPSNVEVLPGFDNTPYGKLCSMFPYIASTVMGEDELTEAVITQNMHTYNPAFFDAAERLGIKDDAESMKKLYAAWKNYLLFVGQNRIADFHSEEIAKKYTSDFAEIYENELERIRKEHPEIYHDVIENNSFLESIGYTESKPGYDSFVLLSTNINGMTDVVLEQYKRDWESLLKYEETAKLATDLAIHFLARSAAFSRDTPVAYMPLRVKEAIPNYIRAFNDANKIAITEEQLIDFITNMCRNNSDNWKLVPHTYNREIEFMSDEKSGLSAISIPGDALSSLSQWLYEDENKDKHFRMPIVKLSDGKLYRIVNDKLEFDKEGDDVFWFIEAKEVTPLGIPNQVVEYVGFNNDSSIFLAEGQEAPNADETSDTQELHKDVETLDLSMPDNNGRRAGTFIEITPFDIDEQSSIVKPQQLARTSISVNKESFYESRNFLQRALKIAGQFGFTVESTQRASRSTKRGPNYVINVAPSKFNADQHEQAKRLAALLGAISPQKSIPEVRTYVSSIEDADLLECAIPFTPTAVINQIETILNDRGIPYRLNIDRNEVIIGVKLTGNEQTDINRIKKATAAATGILSDMKKLGFSKPASSIEANYVKQDVLSEIDKLDILNTLKDEQQEQREIDLADEGGKPAARKRNKGRKQVDIDALVSAAIRREEGEKVNDEIKEILGENPIPLRLPSISFEASSLAEKVVNGMDDKSLSELAEIILANTNSNTDITQKKIDNAIINTANWIRGNFSEENLLSALEGSGITRESAENILAVINTKLNELDIC